MKIGSTLSQPFDVTSGQGTVLVPDLFLIFFDDADNNNEDNDIDDDHDLREFNFADDKKISCVIKAPGYTIRIQNAINKFISCDVNVMDVNDKNAKSCPFVAKEQ